MSASPPPLSATAPSIYSDLDQQEREQQQDDDDDDDTLSTATLSTEGRQGHHRAEDTTNEESRTADGQEGASIQNDSLLDATDDQVEQRALAFLDLDKQGQVLPSTGYHPLDPVQSRQPQQDQQTDADNVDPFNLPLIDWSTVHAPAPATTTTLDGVTSPTTKSSLEEKSKLAQAFLKRCLDRADKDDWMYETPPVFALPSNNTTQRSSSSRIPANVSLSESTSWLERAYNIDAYGPRVDANDDALDSLLSDLAQKYTDTAASSMQQIPMERKGTTGLTRGVSEMAM